MTVREPSWVSRVGAFVATASTYKSFCATYATRVPSGDHFANYSVDTGSAPPSRCGSFAPSSGST